MSIRFNPPPLWLPHLPANFQPTPSWVPENTWGAPPAGWALWVHVENGYPAQPPAEFANNPYLFMSVMPDYSMTAAGTPAAGVATGAPTAQFSQGNSLPQGEPKKPLSKGKKIGIGVAAFIVLAIIIGSCGGSDEQPSSSPDPTVAAVASPSETPAAAVAATPEPSAVVEPAQAEPTEEEEPAPEPEPVTEPEITLPKTQSAFSERVAKAAAEYDATDNELRMTKAITDRNKALCKATGGTFKGWKATVTNVGSTGDGYGYVSVIMEDDIELSTWNNALSDIGSDSLIKPSNKLFDTLLDLSSDDTVTVSGNFLREDSCVMTSNVTEVFDAASPDFKVNFTSIKAD